jgi:hypothetical protein
LPAENPDFFFWKNKKINKETQAKVKLNSLILTCYQKAPEFVLQKHGDQLYDHPRKYELKSIFLLARNIKN